MDEQVIQLEQPQTEVAFTFTTYDETLVTFQAFFDDIKIESATAPVDNRQNNVYGFRTTKKFNKILISTNQWPAWVIDNIQLPVTGSLIGGTLKTSANYNFSLEQGTQKTESIQLLNSGTAVQTAALEVINPHTGLTVTLSQSNPTIGAGETLTLPINLSTGAATPVGAYDGLLLKVTADDGSTLYASLKVYVTSAGAGQQPDLAIIANSIRSTSNTDGTLTLAADVHNLGPAPAENVQVQFYKFGSALGSPVVIDQLSPNGIGTVSITVPALTAGDHLISVAVDPTKAIAELDETNNELSRLITIGSSVPASEGILVTGSLPSIVYTNSLFALSGQAIYDLYINGVRITDYVVKGGSVEVVITGNGIRETYGDVYTDIDGGFVKFLQGLATPGTYQITVTVTDKTFSGTRQLIFNVKDAPAVPEDPPLPPFIGDGTIPNGDWTPSGGEFIWIPTSGPAPPTDLWVLSKNIYFSKNNPATDEEITVFTEINYWAPNTALLALNVPINIYATPVTSPTTPKLKIGQTIIKSLSVGKPDFGSRYVYATWKNQGDGIYLIEFEIDPRYAETNMLNNAATRAIIVGQYGGGSQGIVSGQIVDTSGGLGNVVVHVLDADGKQIGNAITDKTGFYLVSNIPPGTVKVQIDTPNGYKLAETKTVTVTNQAVSTVDFQLLTQESDTTPPVITSTITGTLGQNDWYKSDITVSWTVTDAESTINSKVGCETATVNADTSSVTFNCTATSAGGTAEKSVTVKRDATPPTITGSASPAANANGWRNSPVTVSFTCNDALSGIATCAEAQTIGAEGANQTASGTATDKAGNSATTSFAGISIDRTPPNVSVTGVSNGTSYPLGSVPTTGCATADALSGVQTNATLSVTGGANGLGTFTASCAGASDKAGNASTTVSATYQVYAADSSPPAISPTINGTLGSNGWYTSAVTVSWTVTDSESAITARNGCDPATVATDTAGVTFTCSATSGGGTASNSVTIKRDATPPAGSVTGVADGATYTLGAVPTAGCATNDALSGVQTNATLTVTGGDAGGLGTLTARCMGATDNAGNIGAASATYQVTSTGPSVSLFSAFSLNSLLINQRLKSWVLLSNFTLGSDSNGIDPARESVTLTFANFTATVPAGQFRRSRNGVYAFAGKMNNVAIEALIVPLGNNRFGFQAAAYGASLTGITNPVTVKLTIRNDQGTTSGSAVIR
ncbi:MAG: CARDB domain-containing protein [Candidatus Competibacter sp.]